MTNINLETFSQKYQDSICYYSFYSEDNKTISLLLYSGDLDKYLNVVIYNIIEILDYGMDETDGYNAGFEYLLGAVAFDTQSYELVFTSRAVSFKYDNWHATEERVERMTGWVFNNI